MRRAALLLLLASCSFDFADPGEVVDRRILSVVADPPQLHPGLRQLSLSALVVEPGNAAPSDDFEWDLCAVAAAPAGAGAAPGGFGAASATRCGDGGFLVFQGTSPIDQLALTVPLPPNLPPIGRLEAELVVGGDAGLYAVKRIATEPANHDAPNLNPVLKGVNFDGVDWPEDGGVSLSLGACITGHVETMRGPGRFGATVTSCGHIISPVYDDDVHQTYTQTDALGNMTSLKERLRFAWFTDFGTIENDTTAEPASASSLSGPSDGGQGTTWREPHDGGTGATVWIVVRDGRGGESFTARHVTFR
jgi:hypothetical protein